VWTERVTGERLDAWNTKRAEKHEAVNGVSVQSDADGCFELKLLKVMDRYIIKAFHPLYAVVYSDLYSDDIPPPESVELIIQEDGARLYGRLSDATGNPVTNCAMKYSVSKRMSQDSSHSQLNKILLDVAENGNYISSIVPPGSYDLKITAPGYNKQNKTVTIQGDQAEQCDVEFLAYSVVTGLVCDAETREPIPDVRLTNKSWRVKENHKFSTTTDQNGRFWALSGERGLSIEFQHPSYAPITYGLYQIMNEKYASKENHIKGLSPIIYLSKSGNIRVFGQKSDGTPLDGYRVQVVFDFTDKPYFIRHHQAKFTDGEALLTNVYVMFSPVYVEVSSENFFGGLVKSDMIDIVAGEEVSVTVTLPPTGTLALKFLHSVDSDSVRINGASIAKNKPGTSYDHFFGKNDFTREGLYYILNDFPANMYKISIKDKEIFSLETNVLISANTTTEVIIDNNTNALGSIHGSVAFRNGGIIQCRVNLQEQITGKRIKGAGLSRDSVFAIDGLSLDRLYDLTVAFSEYSMTNMTIRNITPNGPPIDIRMPDAYRITGNVIDSDGTPLKAYIGINSHKERGPGEFTLYPVFPGSYSIGVNAKDYVLVVREVTVYDSNVDLGNIVLSDKGITLTGRIVTPDNSPAKNIRVFIRTSDGHNVYDGRADKEGRFRAQNLPREKAFSVRVYNIVHETETLSSDTDIGDIVLKPDPTK